MRTFSSALACVAAALYVSSVPAQWDEVEIEVTPAGGKVYMLEGRGGNLGASVGEDGIILIDD